MKKFKAKIVSLLTAIMVIMSGLSGCSAAASSQDTTSKIAEINVQYSADDTTSSWSQSSATKIVLKGNSISVNGSGASANGSTLTITDGGTYAVSGTLSDGQIVVDAEKSDTVRIVLNGAQISNSEGSAIYAKQSEKTIITLADGTENKVNDAESYVYEDDEDEPDAAIFSKDDLTINGSGSLKVSGNYKNGIASKDSLVVTGGNITVSAVKDGIRGRDSIAVKDGTFTITAGGDGLQSNNDEDEDKGWICIDSGTFNITSERDAVQAETILQIDDVDATVTTGGGSASASFNAKGDMHGGFGEFDHSSSPDEIYSASKPPGAAADNSEYDPQQPEFHAFSDEAPNTPGSLNVTSDSNEASESDISIDDDSTSSKALKAGNAIIVKAGTLYLDSYDDAMHSNGDIIIKSGKLSISSGDDGIHADSSLVIDGGTISISKSYEGIEGASITINDGTIDLTSNDDGLNAAGGSNSTSAEERPGQDSFDSDSPYFIKINGGCVYINSTGDGIDANGSLYFTGGTVLVSGPTNNGNGALDYDNTCEVTGGTLAIAGSAGMAQSPSAASSQNSITVYYTSVQKAGTLATIADANGNPILSFSPAKDYQTIVVSSPKLETGKTYTVYSGGTNSADAVNGLYAGGTLSSGTQLTSIKVSSTVTRISDDGSEVTSGMGEGARPGYGQAPPDGMGRHNHQQQK